MPKFQIKLGGEWKDFDASENQVLEKAFQAGQAELKFETRGQSYDVDFRTMTQTNVKTGASREIRQVFADAKPVQAAPVTSGQPMSTPASAPRLAVPPVQARQPSPVHVPSVQGVHQQVPVTVPPVQAMPVGVGVPTVQPTYAAGASYVAPTYVDGGYGHHHYHGVGAAGAGVAAGVVGGMMLEAALDGPRHHQHHGMFGPREEVIIEREGSGFGGFGREEVIIERDGGFFGGREEVIIERDRGFLGGRDEVIIERDRGFFGGREEVIIERGRGFFGGREEVIIEKDRGFFGPREEIIIERDGYGW